VVYTAHALLNPLINILNKSHADFIFSYRNEESFDDDDDGRFDDDDDGVEEDDSVHGRLDCIIEATRRDAPSEVHTVLLIEYKRPGVLRQADWTRGIQDGTGKLRNNAEIISQQIRKYLYLSIHNLLAVFDGISMVGTHVKFEDYDRLRGHDLVDLQLFFAEGNGLKFLRLLVLSDVAMAQIYEELYGYR
jgi:hypothetical protein